MNDGHGSLWDFIYELFETTQEKLTALIASAAIVSPVFPGLKETSDDAAMILPILGCVWLVSQILHKWWHFRTPPEGR